MFTTKKQVDQHVKTSLAKLRSENEKRLRGLVIAKMYFKIGEYASAQHYVSGYLSGNEAAPQAHRLLGDCYCKLKQPERALASYQRSYQLDNKQTDLLIDACNLILAEELKNLKATAKFWCEAAANARLQHESVFNVKLKMLASEEGGNKDTKQVEEMIIKEINNRPSEVSPRLQLVNYYISKGRPEDAFKYVSEIMARHPGQFLNSLDWYAAVHKALKLYGVANDVVMSKHWDYWTLSITTVDRLLSLNLALDQNLSGQQSTHMSHCQALLFELDQMLYTAANISFPVRAELAAQMITHFQGQFLLHVASYLFKRERTQSQNQWWTTINNSLPLLFIAFRLGVANTEDTWLKQSNDTTKELVRLWQRQGAFRCSQAGRTLLSCVQVDGADASNSIAPFNSAEELTDAARKHCASRNWTTSLFRNLFNAEDQVAKTGTSFMTTTNLLAEPTFELPTVLRIQMYERMAEALQSDSLPQLVYLYLHNDKLAECDLNVFPGLELTASNIFNCSAATLNKLDIETFLLATVMQTKSRLEVDSKSAGVDGPRPATMPFANMARTLCTEDQLRWWQSAYNSTQGIATDETWNIREVLQDGIEAVRCVGSPKMDLMIALLIGDVLKQKTDNNLAIDLTTKKAYEQRVENIFQCALHLFKNLSTATVTDKRRLFQYVTKQSVIGTEECDALVEGAIVFLAEHFFRAGDYETCVEALTNVQLPYATYYIAEAYKKMDDVNRNNRTPPRNASSGYQNKVKQYLTQTQRLLASGSKNSHSLRNVVSNELRKLQYTDLNTSVTSVDDLDLNSVSFSGGGMLNRSTRQDSQVVVDQVSALTALVTQLTMQNTLLQTEMSDIKKMLQQQKDAQQQAQVTATPPTPAAVPSSDQLYRLEEQQRIAALALANHHSPHYDFMNGRYSVGGYPMGAYQGMPFQNAAAATQYPAHLRGPVGLYGQDASALAMAAQGMYDPMTGAISVPPSMGGQPGVGLNSQQQASLYYNTPPPLQQQPQQHPSVMNQQSGQHSALAGQLQQPPIPLATSSTLDQAFNTNGILKTWNSTYNNEPVEKGAPANVVITSSDPVPVHNTVTQSQKLLSVTIPPQHIKNFGQQHNQLVKSNNDSQPFPTVLSGSFTNNHSSTLSHTATNISGDDTATEEDYYEGGDYEGEEPEDEEEVVAPQTIQQAPVVVPTTFNLTPSVTMVKKDAPAPVAATTDKISFGFGQATKAATDTASSSKPSPFSGFSFGATASAANSSPEKPFSSLFGNIPKPTVTGDLFGLKTPVKDTAAPTPAAVTEPSPAKGEDGEDDYVPTAQFKPVIALPSLVEVKTGEEDEDAVFEHRSKLLRFDPTTKEWKERGLGNIRILVRKDDPSQARLLMRREQVLKLACNQRIAKDQEFKKMPNSETALSWYAQDYAENELKTELFAIRFKTSDICKSFHATILKVQKNMGTEGEKKVELKKDIPKADGKGFGDMFKKKEGSWECQGCLIVNKSDTLYCVACDSPKDSTVPKKEAKPKADPLAGAKPGAFTFGFVAPTAPQTAAENLTTAKKVEDVKPATKAAAEPVKGFGDAFKPKVGSWECQSCYITNKGEDVTCISCSTPKEGSAAPAKDTKIVPTGLTFGAAAASSSGFSFGSGNSSFSFGAATANPVGGGATNAPTSFANLFNKAGTPSLATGGLFGAATTTTEPQGEANANGISFGLEAKPTFNFVFKPKSPGKVKSPQKLINGQAAAEEDAESGDENIEEENTAYFTPVIPLPDRVEAKTGEENETVLYSHRAKLFRFTDGEWKERGLGDVKVLKHTETGKLRVVMRREQVLKICLNHVLDADVEYQVKDNKSWHFVANDFSEGVVELSQFCLRFKTPEVALEFKMSVDDALKESSGDANDTATSLDTSSKATGGETAEELKLVKDLKLPQGYFSYKQAENCSGCRGCNDDEFVFPAVNEVFTETLENALPLQMPTMPPSAANNSSGDLAKSIFGGFNQSLTPAAPVSNSNSSNVFGGSSLFGGVAATTKPLFGGGSVFGGAAAFGSTAVPASATEGSPAATGNIFSGLNSSFGSGGATNTGSLFGSSSVFGSSTNTTAPVFGSTVSVFGKSAATVEPAKDAAIATPIFGQNTFGSTASATAAPTSTFGSFNFGAASQQLSFDQLNESAVTEGENSTTEDDTQKEAEPENIFKMDSNFSFASLAQQEPQNVFGGANQEVSAGGFFGLSNTNDFRHFSKAAAANGNGDAEGDESTDDPNYDPHYEPIIALPEEIAVSTGEEEETKLFGERGCLYRFDSTNKEWKERGVGEFKVLHHPTKNTYRFVMRREQIFKLVLNHAVSADFEFKPLNKTGKSFCWATMNHAEPPGQLEQLAVRFKNTDIAAKFEETVRNCITNLQ